MELKQLLAIGTTALKCCRMHVNVLLSRLLLGGQLFLQELRLAVNDKARERES